MSFFAPSTTIQIVVNHLSMNSTDCLIDYTIRHRLKDLSIERIKIRNDASSNSKRAFIAFRDSISAEKALEILDQTTIGGSRVFCLLDFKSQARPKFDTSQTEVIPRQGPPLQFSSLAYPFSIPLLSSLFRRMTKPNLPELVRIHIAPLPLNMSDERLFQFLHSFLDQNLFHKGVIKLRRSTTYTMAFVDVYNFSSESIRSILHRMCNTIFEGERLVCVPQKNPFDPPRFDQLLGVTALNKVPDELLYLELSPLPSGLTDLQLYSLLKPILFHYFQDEGCISFSRYDGNVSVSIDVFNCTGKDSREIIYRLSNISIGDSAVNVVQKEGRERSDPHLNEAEDNFRHSSRWNRSESLSSRRSRSLSPSRTYKSSCSRPEARNGREKSDAFPVEVASRTRISGIASVDPFDKVDFDVKPRFPTTPPTQRYPGSTVAVSLDDSKSLERLSVPIHTPFDPNTFTRTSSTSISFGYLSPSQAQEALTSTFSPFSNREELQIQYESFLISQVGDRKDYYFELLEKVKSFSKRNKLFGEIAKGLVDLTALS